MLVLKLGSYVTTLKLSQLLLQQKTRENTISLDTLHTICAFFWWYSPVCSTCTPPSCPERLNRIGSCGLSQALPGSGRCCHPSRLAGPHESRSPRSTRVGSAACELHSAAGHVHPGLLGTTRYTTFFSRKKRQCMQSYCWYSIKCR